MKNEMKKILFGLGIVLIFIIMIVISVYTDSKKAEAYIDIVDEALQSKDSTLIYLGREGCGYCEKLEPYLESYKEKYNFEYEYIDTEKANLHLSDILKKLDIGEEEFGTPYLVVVEDGKIVDEQVGYVEEENLFSFLQGNEFIDEEEKLPLSYLEYEDYETMLESGSREIYVYTQTGCSYCDQAKPVLEEVALEYGIDINIVNITNFTEEQNQKFSESLDYISDNQWGTPLILVVEDSEVIDSVEGLKTADEYAAFFEENDIF